MEGTKRKLNQTSILDVHDSLSAKNQKSSSSGQDFLTALSSSKFESKSVQFKEIKSTDLHLSYAESFLSRSVADSLLEFCEKKIQFDEGTKIRVFGKWHAIPRKQVAFGDDGLHYEFSGTKVAAAKWPKEIETLKNLVSEVVGIKFNFALVNRYADGNDYVGEHRDNESELDPNACIASLSIGQCRDFVLRHERRVRKIPAASKEEDSIPENVTLQLKHGSLLLMRPPTNNHWYHSLPKRKRSLGVRINFTFRKLL